MFAKILAGVAALFAALLGVGWLGLKVPMPAFPASTLKTPSLESIQPPQDLPAPVQRYVQAVFGSRIPVIESALITGRGELTVGVTVPSRFKFYHQAGKSYYHEMQGGWFGQTIFTGHERYLNGAAILDIPVGHFENDPSIDAAANQALWAESIWLPSLYFTDARLRWEAVDDTTARLIIPDAAPEEMLIFHFDPQTHLISEITTLRYKDPGSAAERILWTNRVLEWTEFNGVKVPAAADVRWGTDAPWSVWRAEQVLYNVDVSARLNQFGGEVAN